MTPSPQDDPRTLVSTDWLAKHLRDPDLRVLDASWYLPAQNRDAKAEYAAAHIPGARFFDIDEISDQRSVAAPHGATAREVHQPDAGDGRGRRASGGDL
jgi:thiosulfate/3-mercaptopyruvate sulfurtransferase